MFYIWIALAIILTIIEKSAVNLIIILYIISSLIAMIVSLFTDDVPFNWQSLYSAAYINKR